MIIFAVGSLAVRFSLRQKKKEYVIEDEDSEDEVTATCPYCGIDSVLGESSGYPITREFLEMMRKHWFQIKT